MNLYFNTEMREYSYYAMMRATASVVDGMKLSQRKVLFCALRKFGSNNSQILKVAQLGPLAASESNYAHGEDGLKEAIVRMAQDFPGSNNVPLLEAKGAFGSRMSRGDDAANPRYIFTKLSPAARQLFQKDDESVLEYVVDEGQQVEPVFYTPSLPVALLNGVFEGLEVEFPLSSPHTTRLMLSAS